MASEFEIYTSLHIAGKHSKGLLAPQTHDFHSTLHHSVTHTKLTDNSQAGWIVGCLVHRCAAQLQFLLHGFESVWLTDLTKIKTGFHQACSSNSRPSLC